MERPLATSPRSTGTVAQCARRTTAWCLTTTLRVAPGCTFSMIRMGLDPRHETVFGRQKENGRERSSGIARGDHDGVRTGLHVGQLPRLDASHGNVSWNGDRLRAGRVAVLELKCQRRSAGARA